MDSLESLLARALVVMNETRKKLNTHNRIGSLLRDILLFIQNAVLGIILKGSLANAAAIQALATKSKGDTYKANDTGHYWTYDGTTWNDIGEIIPNNVATKDDIVQLSGNISDFQETLQQIDKKRINNVFDYCFFPVGMGIPAFNSSSDNTETNCFTFARNINGTYRSIVDEKGLFPSCFEVITTNEASTAQPIVILQLNKNYLLKRGIKSGDTVMIGAYVRSSVSDSRTFYVNGKSIVATDTNWHWIDSGTPITVTFDTYNQFQILFQNRYAKINEATYITGITVKKVSEISEWYGFEYPQKYYGSEKKTINSGNLFSYYKFPSINTNNIDINYVNIVGGGVGNIELRKVTDIDGYDGNSLYIYKTGTNTLNRVHVNLPPPYYLKNKDNLYLVGAKIRITVSDASIKTMDIVINSIPFISRIKVETNKWQDVYCICGITTSQFDLNSLTNAVTSIEVAFPTMMKVDDFTGFKFTGWNLDIIEDYVKYASFFYGKKWAALGDSVTQMATWMVNVAYNLGMIPYVRGCGSSGICFSIGKMAVKPNGFLIDRQNIYSSYDAFIQAVNNAGFTNEITSVTWQDYSNNPNNYESITNDAKAFFVIETKGNSIDRVNTIPLDDIDIISIMFYNDNSYPKTDELTGTIYDYDGNSYVANFRQLLNKIHVRFPKTKVVLFFPYLVNSDYDYTNNTITQNGKLAQKVRELIGAIAWTYGYPSIDLAKVIDYRTMQLFYGDIHVNSKGQKQMTAYIENEFII